MTNVVFIVWDSTRAHNTSLHGHERETTPFLNELVEEDGVFYEQARAPSSWSLPSHASLFTGLYPREHGTHSKNLVFKYKDKHIANIFSNNGYKTGIFTDNPYVCTDEFQLSQPFNYNPGNTSSKGINPNNFARTHGKGNFIKYLRHSIRNEHTLRSIYNGLSHKMKQIRGSNRAEKKDDSGTSEHIEEFLSWVDDDPSAPFFAFFNFMESHDPYISPEEYQSKYVSSGDASGISNSHWDYRADNAPIEDLDILERKYDGCIQYLDKKTEELLQELEVRGLLEDTVVIITSDHGEGFGEPEELQDTRCIGHQGGISEELLHVPLVIRFPGGQYGGEAVTKVVSIKDVYGTILESCDLLSDLDHPGYTLQPDSKFADQVLSEKNGLSKSARTAARDSGMTEREIEKYDSYRIAYYSEIDGERLKYAVDRHSKREELHTIGKLGLGEEQTQGANIDEMRTGLEEMLSNLSTEEIADGTEQVNVSSETHERLKNLGYR